MNQIWIEHCKEQDEAFIAHLKQVDKALRSRCSLRFRIWLRFLDFLDWIGERWGA